ncbi:uncharacterized protein LOC120255368 [Dioscorea cayenensis subsp. rotundata]|uniref:Uncharacterized protein LOC120255368 n=1 Tax=Dioscorea cayennensis subsp. rotundata TaxID=55577 RepID=A0AB40AVT3_DIOCR|nr:uncharacterized protein LOC120255368 [Dioscorea cayenensis subsp. rotundata]
MWRQSASPGGARNPHSKSLPSSRTNRVPDRNLSDDDEELDEITYGDDSLESLRSLYSNYTKKKQEISLAENENARRELENDSCDHRKSLLMEDLDHDSGDESISDEDNNVLFKFFAHIQGSPKAREIMIMRQKEKRQEVKTEIHHLSTLQYFIIAEQNMSSLLNYELSNCSERTLRDLSFSDGLLHIRSITGVP